MENFYLDDRKLTADYSCSSWCQKGSSSVLKHENGRTVNGINLANLSFLQDGACTDHDCEKKLVQTDAFVSCNAVMETNNMLASIDNCNSSVHSCYDQATNTNGYDVSIQIDFDEEVQTASSNSSDSDSKYSHKLAFNYWPKITTQKITNTKPQLGLTSLPPPNSEIELREFCKSTANMDEAVFKLPHNRVYDVQVAVESEEEVKTSSSSQDDNVRAADAGICFSYVAHPIVPFESPLPSSPSIQMEDDIHRHPPFESPDDTDESGYAEKSSASKKEPTTDSEDSDSSAARAATSKSSGREDVTKAISFNLQRMEPTRPAYRQSISTLSPATVGMPNNSSFNKTFLMGNRGCFSKSLDNLPVDQQQGQPQQSPLEEITRNALLDKKQRMGNSRKGIGGGESDDTRLSTHDSTLSSTAAKYPPLASPPTTSGSAEGSCMMSRATATRTAAGGGGGGVSKGTTKGKAKYVTPAYPAKLVTGYRGNESLDAVLHYINGTSGSTRIMGLCTSTSKSGKRKNKGKTKEATAPAMEVIRLRELGTNLHNGAQNSEPMELNAKSPEVAQQAPLKELEMIAELAAAAQGTATEIKVQKMADHVQDDAQPEVADKQEKVVEVTLESTEAAAMSEKSRGSSQVELSQPPSGCVVPGNPIEVDLARIACGELLFTDYSRLAANEEAAFVTVQRKKQRRQGQVHSKVQSSSEAGRARQQPVASGCGQSRPAPVTRPPYDTPAAQQQRAPHSKQPPSHAAKQQQLIQPPAPSAVVPHQQRQCRPASSIAPLTSTSVAAGPATASPWLQHTELIDYMRKRWQDFQQKHDATTARPSTVGQLISEATSVGCHPLPCLQ